MAKDHDEGPAALLPFVPMGGDLYHLIVNRSNLSPGEAVEFEWIIDCEPRELAESTPSPDETETASTATPTPRSTNSPEVTATSTPRPEPIPVPTATPRVEPTDTPQFREPTETPSCG
ncbi:MAG: hypothetical protein ACLFWD_08265 [Anaerolineales bacterium]